MQNHNDLFRVLFSLDHLNREWSSNPADRMCRFPCSAQKRTILLESYGSWRCQLCEFRPHSKFGCLCMNMWSCIASFCSDGILRWTSRRLARRQWWWKARRIQSMANWVLFWRLFETNLGYSNLKALILLQVLIPALCCLEYERRTHHNLGTLQRKCHHLSITLLSSS